MQKNTLIEQKNGLIACAIFLERLINCGNFSVSNYKDYRMYNLIIRKICNVIRFKRGTAMPRSKSEVVGITFIQRYGNSSPRYMRENHYAFLSE